MTWDDHEYYAGYKSLIEWDTLLKKAGFTALPKQAQLFMDIQRNPQSKYTRMYTKTISPNKMFKKKVIQFKKKNNDDKNVNDVNDVKNEVELKEVLDVIQDIEKEEKEENEDDEKDEKDKQDDNKKKGEKKKKKKKKTLFIVNDVTSKEASHSSSQNNASKSSSSKEDELLFDKNTVFQFYAKSASKFKPGTGTGETIPSEKENQYNELSKIKDWRRQLSNMHTKTFTCDGKSWASVEHYYQAQKFIKNHPDFAHNFSLDSGSAFSKDPNMAKAAGEKNGKYKGTQLRPKTIMVDEDFVENKISEAIENAMYCKFSQHQDQRKLLLATQRAKLNHYVKGQPPQTAYALMRIRKRIKDSQ